MALQDLTPQLRTRLSRMERLVGCFVLIAAALFLAGFAYYAYHTAKRKGWFTPKARYFTLAGTGAGLKPGDPVYLMGFEVGKITRVEAMPPWAEYNVYVEFEIKAPYYGYLWTEGSVARINSADFFGKRSIEVTKGTGGLPTYINNPVKRVTLPQAQRLAATGQWRLAETVRDAQGAVLVPALTPLTTTNMAVLAKLGKQTVLILDSSEERRRITAVWNPANASFDLHSKTNKPYWLVAEEAPALTEHLQRMIVQVESALPGLFALTNRLNQTLESATDAAANMSSLAQTCMPLVSNANSILILLSGDGALGNWLLGPTRLAHADAVLTNAADTLQTLNTNLVPLAAQTRALLTNLTEITGNIDAQLAANSNLLANLSNLLLHTDEFVRGLKRHWLFRSAFREKTNVPAVTPSKRLTSPKERTR